MGIHFCERGRRVPVWLTIESATRRRIEAAIENLLALLDQIDGDCDQEHDTADLEPDGTDEAPDVPAYEVGPPMRALARALYSAVDAMAAAAGEPPDAFGAGHFMSRDLHPFRLNERMAGESNGVG